MELYLIGCGRKKRSHLCRAADMYTGSLFRTTWAYAEGRGERKIISARYGLVEPDQLVSPYDQTIRNDCDSHNLALQVIASLLSRLPYPQRVVILASEPYYRHIVPELRAAGMEVETPLHGLTMGQRMHFLRCCGDHTPGRPQR